MIEIHPNLYVGHQGDYEYQVKGQDGWAVVHACKEPYHRQLLGYTARGAPKDHSEYLFAERGNRLYLNLVDANDPACIPKEIIDKAIAFTHEKLAEGLKVLVHCNQGESRSPGIGFLYLLRETDVLPQMSLDDALAKFREIYPAFSPSGGISGFIAANWEECGLPRHSSTMKFSPRELMERAVEVMRDSVCEPREDDKASPKVGAVLFKADGTIDTASRGELRYGDHAEYTLLERKNRDAKLDGSILFSTLEPCAPGARAHPKLSCAERIVLARISEVWVGIEDPDPTVDRKGIKYLQDNKVPVHMFDRDLQEIIQAENEAFITQAHERAAAEEEEAEEVLLSELEAPVAGSLFDDFSREALLEYITRSGMQETVASSAFRKRLTRQGIVQESDGKLTPTGFGVLLFGQEPRVVMHQAGLLGTIHYPDGTEETRDFDQPLVLIPDLVEEWLRNKLPSVISRDQMRRVDVPALPFKMVREAVVNALIHRDYDIEGAKCQLIVDEHTVVIMSPGPPPPPITVQQLQSFNAPMLSRNPGLHYVFARMDLAEERGLGIKSLKAQAEQAGLPLPKYAFNNPYLVLTLYRSPTGAVRAVWEETLQSLSTAEKTGWEWLTTRDVVTSAEYAEAMGIPSRTALNHLKHLTEFGLLRRMGGGPSTRYEVVR
jgi:ATP-dependent DNA helicase RecG